MRQMAVLTALFVYSSAAFAVDPQLLNMVMPDAKILAGVNATNTRISPFGQYIISKVASLGKNPPKLTSATGFNPFEDVSEVLAATAADASKPGGLLLARGNFDVEKIVAAVSGRPRVQVQTLDGATLVSFTNAKNNAAHTLAFLGNSIAVAGNLANVEAALARTSGSSNAIDPALAVEVNQLSSSEDEWIVSSVSVASLIPAKAAASTGPAAQILPVLKSIQSFNGGIDFTSNVQFTAQAVESDAQSATALSAAIRLMVTVVSMGSTGNAQLADLAPLLQTLEVTTSGATVNLSLSIPETQVEALLNQVLKPPASAVSGDARSRRRRGN